MNQYKKGARKEYKIVKDLKKEGYDIVQRTAGSHSPYDIIAIDKTNKKILLVQSKRDLSRNMNYIDPHLKKKLEKENKWIKESKFEVDFEAR